MVADVRPVVVAENLSTAFMMITICVKYFWKMAQ